MSVIDSLNNKSIFVEEWIMESTSCCKEFSKMVHVKMATWMICTWYISPENGKAIMSNNRKHTIQPIEQENVNSSPLPKPNKKSKNVSEETSKLNNNGYFSIDMSKLLIQNDDTINVTSDQGKALCEHKLKNPCSSYCKNSTRLKVNQEFVRLMFNCLLEHVRNYGYNHNPINGDNLYYHSGQPLTHLDYASIFLRISKKGNSSLFIYFSKFRDGKWVEERYVYNCTTQLTLLQ